MRIYLLVPLLSIFLFACQPKEETTENTKDTTPVTTTESIVETVESPALNPDEVEETTTNETKGTTLNEGKPGKKGSSSERKLEPIKESTTSTSNTQSKPKTTSSSTTVKAATPIVETTIKTPVVKEKTPVLPEEKSSKVGSAPGDPPPPVSEEPPAPVKAKLSHAAWDQLLRKHVTSSGKVNYAGFKKDGAALDAYLKLLAANPIESSWSRNKKMAYWINAYNAFTVKKIVENYPVSSIQDIAGGKVWDLDWIKLGTKTYSLNQIENKILRPQYKDARIHFAVNCAANSCPRLMNKAFSESGLERELETMTKTFVNNSTYNQISEKKISVSKIFEWYASDFGNLIDFLNKYSDTKIKNSAKVDYLDYDWKLNKQ